jgi:Uma2 family endonuclease
MATKARWTSAVLAHLPDDGHRLEIIDGDLYVSRQPDWHHQVVCTRLGGWLDAWSMETGIGLAAAAPGLIFAEDDDVVADLVWLSHARLAVILQGGKLHGAPELAIEVLSPGSSNQQRDRETKRKLYARRGVDEYWIVDWQSQTVDIYRRDGVDLARVATLTTGQSLASPLLPGFAAPLDRLFAERPSTG